MSNIIPLAVPKSTSGEGYQVAPLAWVTSRMVPGLLALILPGESFEDALTRREAARDILDDLLAEYAEGVSS